MKIKNYFSWLKYNWAQVGLILAIYISVLSILFVRESNFIVFLLLIQTPLYMLHETEEYLFPGGFETFFNQNIFKIKEGNGPLNKNFIVVVNITLVWIILPLFALLSLKSLSFGLWIPYFTIFAGIAHIALSIKSKKLYNPGLLISLILNIPIGSAIVFYLYKNGYINNLFLNFNLLIGLLINLLLPILGLIILKNYKKKII